MTDFPAIRRRALMGALGVSATLPWLGQVTPAQAAANDLVVGVPDNLTGLDPADINDTLSQSACRLMFQGLYGFDPQMKLIPVLAESYTADDSAKVFTFKLRQGISFHDGTPFDAQAVKANFERVANPENRLKRQSLLAMLDRVEVVDPMTARVILKEPFGAFVNTIAHPAGMMLSPKAIAQYGKEIGRNPVGTGPFTFVSWNADTLKVKKNTGYWKPGLPKVETVTFRSVPENGARIAMLQTGEAQFIYPLPPEMAAVVQRSPNVEIVNEPSIIARYVSLNCMKKPFTDVRVRQALNHAVNKEAYAKVVYNGFAQPLDAPIPPKLGFYSQQEPYAYDVAKAKQLLAEAGYPNGFGITLHCTNDRYLNDEAICQAIAGFLGRIGVKTAVSSRPLAIQTAAINNQETDFYLYGWGVPTYDSAYVFDYLVHTRGKNGRGNTNATRYSNAELDSQIVSLASEGDARRRDATIHSIWSTVQKELIYLPLHDQIQTYAMVRKFDIPVNPSNTPYFKLFKQPGARQAAVAGAQ